MELLPEDLLKAYATGLFPMSDDRDDDVVYWVNPDLRGIIPLDGFNTPRRLARTVRAEPFEIRIDTAFHDVMLGCAGFRPGVDATWINRPIERAYVKLHKLGHAHSVECWEGGQLIGGLYGVSLGRAFFGESMFSRQTDASKIALVHLVAGLIKDGFVLLDTQFTNAHLEQFGVQEIPRAAYRHRLAEALKGTAQFQGTAGLSGASVLQLINHMS